MVRKASQARSGARSHKSGSTVWSKIVFRCYSIVNLSFAYKLLRVCVFQQFGNDNIIDHVSNDNNENMLEFNNNFNDNNNMNDNNVNDNDLNDNDLNDNDLNCNDLNDNDVNDSNVNDIDVNDLNQNNVYEKKPMNGIKNWNNDDIEKVI
jgi:hypothetical protein